MGVTVKGDPAGVLTRWKGAVRITQADAAYALERQRTRILERTARGVDVNGSPFRPYSTKGPYYYYPSVHLGNGKAAIKTRKNAVRRLLKITGEVSSIRAEYQKSSSVGGVRTRSGLGIRFESYADFKRSIGRSGVDLFGPRAPHMLQAMVIKVTGSPATEGRIGIYGAAADRASGHQYGTRKLPQRRFLGASPADREQVKADILTRIKDRLTRKT